MEQAKLSFLPSAALSCSIKTFTFPGLSTPSRYGASLGYKSRIRWQTGQPFSAADRKLETKIRTRANKIIRREVFEGFDPDGAHVTGRRL
jgi:hypothetical protein